MRFAFTRAHKAGQYAFDGHARGHFALLLSTNSVCKCEQAAMGAQLRGRVREDIAQVILVMFPYASGIRKLGELDVEHKTLKMQLPPGKHPEQFTRAFI